MNILGLTSWSTFIAFAVRSWDFLIFCEEIHNCSDRNIFTTVYFGVESCTGRGADFQKLFKGSWWFEKLEAPARFIKEPLVCTPYCRWSLYRGNFPSEVGVVHFRLMQVKPAQVLSKLWSKHCSDLGIAACAEPGFKGAHTLSAKLFTWEKRYLFSLCCVLLWCHSFLPGFVSKHRWQVLCVCVFVCAQLYISRKFPSLSFVVLDLLQGGFTWENWQVI